MTPAIWVVRGKLARPSLKWNLYVWMRCRAVLAEYQRRVFG